MVNFVWVCRDGYYWRNCVVSLSPTEEEEETRKLNSVEPSMQPKNIEFNNSGMLDETGAPAEQSNHSKMMESKEQQASESASSFELVDAAAAKNIDKKLQQQLKKSGKSKFVVGKTIALDKIPLYYFKKLPLVAELVQDFRISKSIGWKSKVLLGFFYPMRTALFFALFCALPSSPVTCLLLLVLSCVAYVGFVSFMHFNHSIFRSKLRLALYLFMEAQIVCLSLLLITANGSSESSVGEALPYLFCVFGGLDLFFTLVLAIIGYLKRSRFNAEDFRLYKYLVYVLSGYLHEAEAITQAKVEEKQPKSSEEESLQHQNKSTRNIKGKKKPLHKPKILTKQVTKNSLDKPQSVAGKQVTRVNPIMISSPKKPPLAPSSQSLTDKAKQTFEAARDLISEAPSFPKTFSQGTEAVQPPPSSSR